MYLLLSFERLLDAFSKVLLIVSQPVPAFLFGPKSHWRRIISGQPQDSVMQRLGKARGHAGNPFPLFHLVWVVFFSFFPMFPFVSPFPPCFPCFSHVPPMFLHVFPCPFLCLAPIRPILQKSKRPGSRWATSTAWVESWAVAPLVRSTMRWIPSISERKEIFQEASFEKTWKKLVFLLFFGAFWSWKRT